MPGIRRCITQNDRFPTVNHDRQVQSAVAIVVGVRSSAADDRFAQPRTCLSANFKEATRRLLTKDVWALRCELCRVVRQLQSVAVDHPQIKMAVIVEVSETGGPANHV